MPPLEKQFKFRQVSNWNKTLLQLETEPKANHQGLFLRLARRKTSCAGHQAYCVPTTTW